MSADINAYLAKTYSGPPCWELVADYYSTELDLPVTEFKTVNSDVRSVAKMFRLALSKGAHGFFQIDYPQDHAVMLLCRIPKLGFHHCGVVIGNSVLHAVEPALGGVKYEDMSTIMDVYPIHQFWLRAGDV